MSVHEMADPRVLLRPLADAQTSIEALTSYETPAQLAAALRGSWRGVELSLRHVLRADPDAPDDLRLSALSPADLPYDRLVPALRRRNLISLRLAGMAHELEQIARRAEVGDVHAADADAALVTIARLREEIGAHPAPVVDAPLRVESGEPVTLDLADDAALPDGGGRRRLLFVALGLLVAGAALVFALLRSADPFAEGVAAFGDGRLGVAESAFLRAVERDDQNVTSLLYLARIYRRQDRQREAAEVLQKASELAPRDPAVRRELGYLFLDLNRPQPAVQQFREAVELEPADERNWMALIRALRAAGDPEADDVLRRAPAEVRAALTSGLLPPDTT